MFPTLHAASVSGGASSLPELFSFSTLRQEAEATCADGCLTKWKVIFAVVLLLEGMLFGQVAYLLKLMTSRNSEDTTSRRSSKFKIALHFGNALSAGVFFATGMLHILPETIELLSGTDPHTGEETEGGAANEEGAEHDEGHEEGLFPWAYLVVILAFYGVFALEKIIVPRIRGSDSRMQRGEEDIEVGPMNKDSTKDSSIHLEENEPDEFIERTKFDGIEEARGFRSEVFVSGLIQILALSAHSLFESMALGISGDFTTVLNIFIATTSHRWLTSTAISFKFARSLKYLPFLVLLALFSTMVPLGIGVGAALTSLSPQLQGVLFGVSAGTFLYIGVFESMADEFVVNKRWMLRKFLATLVGAGIIVLTTGLLVAYDVHG